MFHLVDNKQRINKIFIFISFSHTKYQLHLWPEEQRKKNEYCVVKLSHKFNIENGKQEKFV